MPRYGYKPPQRMFKPLDPGTYIAWLVQFIDLGTHTEETQWGTKDVRKGRFVFAVPDVLTDAGRPMVVGTTMSLTTHEKGNYRKMIQSWTGRAFNDQSFMDYDDRELFNIPVMIQVGHKGEADDAYAIILSYNMPLRGIPINGLPEDQEYLYLSLEPDRFDNNEFEKLDSMMTEKSAAKLKEQITTSFEWEKLCNPPADQPAQEEAPEDVWHTEDPLPPEDAQPEEEAPAPEPAPPPQRQAAPARQAPSVPGRPVPAAATAPKQAAPAAQRPAPVRQQAAPVQQRPVAAPVARNVPAAPAPAPRPSGPAPARPAAGAGSISARATGRPAPAPAARQAAPASAPGPGKTLAQRSNDPDLQDEIPF